MPKKKVTEAVEEVVQEPVVSEPVPPQAPRRQGSDDLLELNDLVNVAIHIKCYAISEIACCNHV